MRSSLTASSHSVQMISWSLPHTAWWLSSIYFSWASDQRQLLVMQQGAHTFFWNFLQAVLTAASSVSEHMRQSLVADSGPESTALSCELLLKSDSLPLWSASSSLTSAANLSSEVAAALTGLEGRLTILGCGCIGLWMAISWMGGVLCPLLTMLFSVPA